MRKRQPARRLLSASNHVPRGTSVRGLAVGFCYLQAFVRGVHPEPDFFRSGACPPAANVNRQSLKPRNLASF